MSQGLLKKKKKKLVAVAAQVFFLQGNDSFEANAPWTFSCLGEPKDRPTLN